MEEFIIVEQTDTDIMVVASSDIPDGRKSAAIAKVFPVGSDWGDYINARSFRFMSLKHNFYLLSYTLVLGQQEKLWDGTLRAWGLVGRREDFLSGEGLNKYDPQELFQRHEQLFGIDPYAKIMLNGLTPALTSLEMVKIPEILKAFKWAGLILPMTFSLPFSTRSTWASVESVLYKQWHDAVTSGLGKHLPPISFTTFTLSKRERTKMKGIPSGV
jgi:hypothetical protein